MQAKQAVLSKQMSERCERRNERTSKWLSTYVPIFSLSEPQYTVYHVGGARLLGIKVGCKKKYHIGDFLMLVGPISNMLG